MTVKAIDRIENLRPKPLAKAAGKLPGSQVESADPNSRVDSVELSRKPLEKLYAGITLTTNQPGSFVVIRQGGGYNFPAESEDGKSLDERFQEIKAGLQSDAPNSPFVKDVVRMLHEMYKEYEKRTPYILKIERITFKEEKNAQKALYQYKAPSFGGSMLWELWYVKKPDGTTGYDYVNARDTGNRIYNNGELIKKTFRKK